MSATAPVGSSDSTPTGSKAPSDPVSRDFAGKSRLSRHEPTVSRGFMRNAMPAMVLELTSRGKVDSMSYMIPAEAVAWQVMQGACGPMRAP